MVNTPFNYKREITHTEYRHGSKKVKKGGLKGRLHTVITDDKHRWDTETLSDELPCNDKFLVAPTSPKVVPVWGGGAFLLIFLGALAALFSSGTKEISFSYIIVTSMFFLGFLFFVSYYYTMPVKEFIWNREDGLVTFPGFMWHKNITMPIDKIIFSMTGPGVQGLGAFQLQIERPDMFYTKRLCRYG